MYEVFSKGSNIFSLVFPTGEKVLFKPLPYNEWLGYKKIIDYDLIDIAIVEEDIFQKCVVNPEVVPLAKDMWPAGIITTIVAVVLKLSGNPITTDEDKERFNLELSIGRERLKDVANTTTMLICKAFPSYTPEQVDLLDWDKRMLRLAQAEEILLRTKFISEPISLKAPGQEEEKIDPRIALAKQVTEDSRGYDKELFTDVEAEEQLEQRRLDALRRIKEMKDKKKR